ncbi:MAG: ABC transporter permease [Christensenellales bacterium]
MSVLLLALLTTFFSLSLNLYRNSRENIRLADETYSTIAVMELYADVDSRGNLLAEVGGVEDYAGYLPTIVHHFELSPIINAAGVERYDLRARYGAYIPDEIAVRPSSVTGENDALVLEKDIIRFSVQEDTPISTRMTEANVTVYDSATESYMYADALTVFIYLYEWHKLPYADDIAKLNSNAELEEGALVLLKADTEYVASVQSGLNSSATGLRENGQMRTTSIGMMPDEYGAERYIKYSEKGERLVYDAAENQPFWLMKYEDVQSDAALSSYFEKARNAYYITARSFGVMAAEDVMGVPIFHLGNVFMREGRTFNEDEYASGLPVCIVSSDIAQAQGWKIGDKLDMNFYEFEGFLNDTSRYAELRPAYNKNTQGFFDSAEYEIVGIYEMRPIVGTSTVSEAALSVPWNTIFVPKRSIRNAPAESELPVSGALLTLWIENGKIEPFLEEMDALGITGQKAGDYEAKFTFYDQGYSNIQPSLNALSGTAELLLILSSVLLLTAAVLLAFFFVLSQKQNLGVMRMLGCSRARAFCTVFLSALLIAALGVGAGAAAGHALTEQVGQRILAEANTAPEAYRAFSAYIASGQNAAMEFALGANARTTAFALAAALGLFLLGTAAFTLRYLAKEPRALLPESHA